MTHRTDKTRKLGRAGFTFLSGWVRNEDAPPMRDAFARGAAQAEAALLAPDYDHEGQAVAPRIGQAVPGQ